MTEAVIFSAAAIALYAGHHVGDYWVQTDHQAQHKGAAGQEGVIQCALHVLTYTLTQTILLVVTLLALDLKVSWYAALVAMLISAVTHYLADRREYGLMLKLARLIPGKARFIRLGIPRAGAREVLHRNDAEGWTTGSHYRVAYDDNPSLGTGAWALDQSWHIALGVWLPALLLAVLS